MTNVWRKRSRQEGSREGVTWADEAGAQMVMGQAQTGGWSGARSCSCAKDHRVVLPLDPRADGGEVLRASSEDHHTH